MASPFLTPLSHAQEGQLATLHLRRDLALPTILLANASSSVNTGYAEGVVTNTRFGSFPHSTLVGLPWGSQVRASQVDTGSRGQKPGDRHAGKKRKAYCDDFGDENGESAVFTQKEVVTASSGFIHVLPPTPENWTTSLPHRTQIVYTPDYSYVLHRIRARPGTVVIEAGSGSGSFTHAAARAVFNGYPPASNRSDSEIGKPNRVMGRQSKFGRVFTYEFHSERHGKVAAEMKDHGLDSLVHATQRDVYNEGFTISSDASGERISPVATAVFLDLPAPWQALPHLTRISSKGEPTPLDPSKPVYICTFSPCIEQAQKTASALRQHDWLEIEMVEMQQKRIEVRRECTGLEYEGMRGVNAFAANVEQALSKLREVERRARDFHTGPNTEENEKKDNEKASKVSSSNNFQDMQKALFNQGTPVHRSEPELKTHTSYLVFAVLPREWTESDEIQTRTNWKGSVSAVFDAPKSQRQLKREAKQKARVKDHDENQGIEKVSDLEHGGEDGIDH